MWADIFTWSLGISQHSEGAAPQDVGVPSAGLDKCLSGGPEDGSCGHRDAREQAFTTVPAWLNEFLMFKSLLDLLWDCFCLMFWVSGHEACGFLPRDRTCTTYIRK